MVDNDNAGERHKTENVTEASEGSADMAPGAEGGEDEGSAPVEGNDDHLHDDQKPITK